MKEPEEVFTPSSPNVNPVMYIHRPDREAELVQAIKESKHLVLYGESGTGKSWLFKKVFADSKVEYLNCNMANASRFGSIAKELENTVDRELENIHQATRTTSKKEGEATADMKAKLPFLGRMGAAFRVLVSGEKQKEYRIVQKEPVERAFEFLHQKNKKSTNVLVFDNFESIVGNTTLLEELSNIILLLDDERYGKYRTKILIVGTPVNILYVIVSVAASRPVARRIRQLDKLDPLSKDQVRELLRKGFEEELGFDVPSLDDIVEHVMYLTHGIPDRVHEYGLELAKLAKPSMAAVSTLFTATDQKWVANNLADLYAIIQSAMNARETEAGRRNQVIYALGQLPGKEVKLSELEDIVRKKFPNSTSGKTLNMSLNLGDLMGRENPMITKNVSGDGYVFTDLKFKLCIRSVIVLEGEVVKIREF